MFVSMTVNDRSGLKVNGALKQSGNTRDMIFALPFLISHISNIMTLEKGDLILTGTPAGVGKLEEGDGIEVTNLIESA